MQEAVFSEYCMDPPETERFIDACFHQQVFGLFSRYVGSGVAVVMEVLLLS